MRVLLIGPMEVTDKMYYSPPLGIHRIGSFLKRNGIECRIIDPTIEDIPRTEAYDIIGYSVLGSNLINSITHAKRINRRPGQRIVFGGIDATFNYSFIAVSRCADAVILGEGEFPMLHLSTSTDTSPYPGIVHIRDNKIINKTYARALSAEMFESLTLNMDYPEIPYPMYWETTEKKCGNNFDPSETRTIRLYIKNRCGFRCNFCASTNFYRAACGKNPPIVTIKANKVADLLVRLTEVFPDVRTFFFQDDEFFFPKKNILALCSYIQAHPALRGRNYLCQGRVEAISPELLEVLVKSGFKKLILGIENFSPKILGELSSNKTSFLEKYDKTITSILEHKIVPFINIILTSPVATVRDIIINADKCLEYALKGAEIGMNLYCMAWAGSEMASRDVEKDGLNILPKDKGVRSLIKEVDTWYGRFLEWSKENGGVVRITSTTRSIYYVLMLNYLLRRSNQVEQCRGLLSRGTLKHLKGPIENTILRGLIESYSG